MKEDQPTVKGDREKVEPALTPLGTPPEPPLRTRQGEIIHVAPEMAIAEADIRSAEQGEFVSGTSLWRDAWRRLLKNKLAVFGMVVVAIITLASIIGPFVIAKTTGYTPDYIPRDARLITSLPPFKAPDGSFSWIHPMGTDVNGR